MTPPAERIVRCPCCGGPSVYSPANPQRPFCSPRCATQDLSAWASERYVVASAPDPLDPPDPAGADASDPV